MRTLVAALAALILLSAHAKADIVEEVLGCKGDPCVVRINLGGNIGKFVDAANAIAFGDRKLVIIDGECASACTVLIDRIKDKVCLTAWAKLEFHRGSRPPFASVGIFSFQYKKLIDIHYSPAVEEWIQKEGGLPKDGSFITMPVNVAMTIWSPCPPRTRPARKFSAHGLY